MKLKGDIIIDKDPLTSDPSFRKISPTSSRHPGGSFPPNYPYMSPNPASGGEESFRSGSTAIPVLDRKLLGAKSNSELSLSDYDDIDAPHVGTHFNPYGTAGNGNIKLHLEGLLKRACKVRCMSDQECLESCDQIRFMDEMRLVHGDEIEIKLQNGKHVLLRPYFPHVPNCANVHVPNYFKRYISDNNPRLTEEYSMCAASRGTASE